MTTTVTERPIIMGAESVLAILDGRKTETRRPLRPQPPSTLRARKPWASVEDLLAGCPYGQPGDRLWVRETWAKYGRGPRHFLYRASYGPLADERPWKPSIFMPRAACRLTLEILAVRVERLQEINGFDARAEGYPDSMPDCDLLHYGGGKKCRRWYQAGWDALNARRGFGWEKNPWVWVIQFKRA
jgi:hypothetical protein